MAPATLVEEVRAVLDEIRLQKGDFVIAMLYSSSEEGDNWNVIVSAPWADEMRWGDAVGFLIGELGKSLSKKNIPFISRVTVLDPQDPFVLGITSEFSTRSPGTTINISNSSFGGVRVPRGVLFYSQKPVAAGS